MSCKFFTAILLSVVLSVYAHAQISEHEYFVVASSNLYLPGSSSSKAVFPIIGYNKESDPKLLIGGFGLGVSVFKSLQKSLDLKGNANLSRCAYWSETMVLRDPNNQSLGQYSVRGIDYSFGCIGTVHYFLTDKFSIGTGLGAQVLLVSKTRFEFEDFLTKSSSTLNNKYYKPVMPVVPLELALKFQKLLINIRYEYALLNRYKNDLADSATEKYGLLTFEVGFRIK